MTSAKPHGQSFLHLYTLPKFWGVGKGELKERPSVGCGISDMLLDNDMLYWRNLIREQLEMDKQKINHIKITKTSIFIDAQY